MSQCGEVLRGVEARGHLQVTKPKSGNVVQTAGVVVHLCGGFVRFCGENARRTIPNRGDVSRQRAAAADKRRRTATRTCAGI